MNIYVDLDNTLCLTSGSDYENSQPIESRIVKVNNLKEQGNQIIIWTARGSNSGIDWSELTKNQLQKWNIKYDKLLLQKPPYDLYIDDKSINVDASLASYHPTKLSILDFIILLSDIYNNT